MRSCFPYEYYDLFEMKDVISIKSNNKSIYIAYLTKDSVIIHNSFSINHDFSSKYTRSEESLSKIGSNHWLQWITPNEIAFGTCTGKIFISKISDEGVISEPITTEITGVITSTFSANDMLGVCLSSMNIIFVDLLGNLRYNVHLDIQGCGIQSAIFYKPSLFVGVANNQAFRVKLTKNVLSREEKPQVSFVPVKGVLSVTQSLSHSLIAITRERGNLVIALQQSEANGANITKEAKEGEDVNEIIFTEFSLDGTSLYSFTRNGDIIIWSASTAVINRVNQPAIKDATCIEFDRERRRAFFAANGHIHLIEFISFNSFIGATPRSVYLLSANPQIPAKKVFSFEENSLYDAMYPLLGAKKVAPNKLILYNRNGFFVYDTEEKSASSIVKMKVLNIDAVMGAIVVLTKSESSSIGYVAAFFDINCNELKWFQLEHIPLTMQVCRNKVVITSNTKFTVIKLDLEKSDSRFIVINDKTVYISLKVLSSTEQINNAVTNEKSKEVVLFVNKSVGIFSNKDILENGVSTIWYDSSTDMLVMVKPQEYTIFFNGGIFRFKGCALFSDGTYLYSILPRIEFGKISFRCDDVFPFLIDPVIGDEESFRLGVKHFQHSPAFSTLLARLIIHEVSKGRFNILFKRMNLFDSSSLAAIMNSFSLMANEETKYTIVNADYNWSPIIEFCDKETQQMILMSIDKEQCIRFIEKINSWKKHLKPEIIDDVVFSLIEENKFKKAMIFASNFDIDMQKLAEKCEKTKSMSLQNLADIAFSDAEQWTIPASMIPVLNQQIRYLCSLLVTNGNQKLAFALLLSNGDTKKLASLIAMNDEIAEEIKQLKLESEKANNILRSSLNLL